MLSGLDQLQSEFKILFDGWLNQSLAEAKKRIHSEILLQSQQYSLLTGGKRFRPFLAFLVFRIFSEDSIRIKNFCLALEMIHTYSLIHDDLPCMDNDDFRRGKPTNHKVFSEDISLLAGDGLLTDAFYMLAVDEFLTDEAKVRIIKLLAEKIGSGGMVGGQALDMKADQKIDFNNLHGIHKLKTANLIQAAAVGAAMAADCTKSELHNISEFSYNLGMSFQIKDDLLDRSDEHQDFKSYLTLLGAEKTLAELKLHSELARNSLKLINRNSTTAVIEELIEFNLKRNS